MINEEIQKSGISLSKQVRVIGPEGEQMGVYSLANALNAAYDKGLDLVLIAPNGEMPVVKIMDYGKFRFDRDKRKKEAKKNQQKVSVKEVQLSCQIDVNDFNVKVNNAKRFLKNGDKVKVLVVFRGRQMSHQDMGRDLLTKFAADVSEFGSVDKPPVMEGRSMSMLITPIKQTTAK
ncbi:MAG: translation initiation factor IF-3 [Eubacteriales bacterium]